MTEAQYLIDLLKAAIAGKNIEEKESVDMEAVFSLAKAHDVANIACYALDGLQEKPKNYSNFQKSRDMAVLKDVRQGYEITRIFEEFNKNNIDFMPLKGYRMKKLYPSSDMRTMADIDILIKDSADFNMIKKIMREGGYSLRAEKNGEVDYLKPPVMNVEISDSLLAEVQKKWEWYFDDYWKKAIKDKLSEYKQSDEDYFIYHIVHLSKHYSMYGTGIRPFLDIYIFLKEKNNLDWTYINGELENLGLEEFCKNCIELSNYWFSGGKENSLTKKMAEYVIESGVYGTLENKLATRSINNGKVDNTGIAYIKRYFFGVFPSYRTMTNLYLNLKKYPFLLPYYWVCRWIRKIKYRDEIKDFVEFGRNIDYEKAKNHNEHMKSVGL